MKAVWLAFGLLAASVVVVTFHDVLLVFFAAAIFAVPLHRSAAALARALRAPLAVGLGGTIGAGLLVAAAILWLWEALIAAQVHQLAAALPRDLAGIVEILQREPWASRIAGAIPDPTVLLTGAGGMVGVVRGFAGSTIAALLDAAILVFVAACFAAEPRVYVGGLLRFVRPVKRLRVKTALDEAATTIALWLRARAISMVTVGVLAGVGVQLAGIPDAAALGVLAGIFAFVPNVGPIAAGAPALLLAAPLGWQHMAAVVVIYWLAHALDDFFVIPIAERRIVRLPPALTIAAQVVLGLAGGMLGIMMAAPFVAVAIVLLRRLVVEDIVEAEPPSEPRPLVPF